jgi:hypothetical protein
MPLLDGVRLCKACEISLPKRRYVVDLEQQLISNKKQHANTVTGWRPSLDAGLAVPLDVTFNLADVDAMVMIDRMCHATILLRKLVLATP